MKEKNAFRSSAAVFQNIFKSFGLVLLLMGLVLALSTLLGYWLGDIRSGLLTGMVLCAVFLPLQMAMAKRTILAMTRGRPLAGGTPQEAAVRDIAERLSRRAGFSRVPDLYVTSSTEPNAFASGTSPSNAFIGVTQGLLDRLDYGELEGVLAHEMSHIAHRDILVSQLAVSLVSVILLLSSFLNRFFLFGGRRRSSNRSNGGGGAALLLLALLALLLQPLAMIISNLIQLAISRKREYAADAGAVALCGAGRGLASALEKISGASYSRQQVQDLGGAQMQSMYIYFPKQRLNSLFSTHPPVEERIRRLREMGPEGPF